MINTGLRAVGVVITPSRHRRGAPDGFGARVTVYGRESAITVTELQPPCLPDEERRAAAVVIRRLVTECEPYKRVTVNLTVQELRQLLASFDGWKKLTEW